MLNWYMQTAIVKNPSFKKKTVDSLMWWRYLLRFIDEDESNIHW